MLEWKSKKVLRELPWNEGENLSAAISPDGSTAALAGSNVVRFVDVASGNERRLDIGTKEQKDIFATTTIKFAPDGSRVAVVGEKGNVRLVSTWDGRLLGEMADLPKRDIAGVAFSADGKTLLTRGWGTPVWIWETATGQLVRVESGDSFLGSPDGRSLIVLKEDAFHLYDLFTGELLRKCQGGEGYNGNFTWSRDGKRLAASCADTSVLIWDLRGPARKEPALPLKFSKAWALQRRTKY